MTDIKYIQIETEEHGILVLYPYLTARATRNLQIFLDLNSRTFANHFLSILLHASSFTIQEISTWGDSEIEKTIRFWLNNRDNGLVLLEDTSFFDALMAAYKKRLFKSIIPPMDNYSDLFKPITPFLDSYSDLFKPITPLMDNYSDLFKSIIPPMDNYSDLFKSIIPPMDSHSDLLKSINFPLSDYPDLLKSINFPLSDYPDFLKSINLPLDDHSDLLKSVKISINSHSDLLKPLRDQFDQLIEFNISSLKILQDSFKTNLDNVFGSFKFEMPELKLGFLFEGLPDFSLMEEKKRKSSFF